MLSRLIFVLLQGAMVLRQLLGVVAVLGLVSVAAGAPLLTRVLLPTPKGQRNTLLVDYSSRSSTSASSSSRMDSSSSAAAALVVAPPSGNSYHASRRHASSASCSCTPIQTSMIDATSTVACVLMCLTVCRLHGCPAAANSACESSSVMFGSPWSPGNPLYIQVRLRRQFHR